MSKLTRPAITQISVAPIQLAGEIYDQRSLPKTLMVLQEKIYHYKVSVILRNQGLIQLSLYLALSHSKQEDMLS